ncbi:MAG: DUF5674 family protein [Candidatus Aenigmatarchaeota archaeon]
MKIIKKTISKSIILKKYNHFFKTMIKAVVDIEKEIIALDAELHADLESLLIKMGCNQKDLWGINLYLKKEKDNWIEYTALINIRPASGNSGMEIESRRIREKINKIVYKLIN